MGKSQQPHIEPSKIKFTLHISWAIDFNQTVKETNDLCHGRTATAFGKNKFGAASPSIN